MEPHVNAVPPDLAPQFMKSLLAQAFSSSYDGAPAAKRMLQNLSEEMGTIALGVIDDETLEWRAERKSFLRDFVKKHLSDKIANPMRLKLKDFVKMDRDDFLKKHFHDSP